MVAIIFSGTIGHVAHGKSTVVKALSGVQVGNKGRIFQQQIINNIFEEEIIKT